MDRFDVAIVGAGPAGCRAAFRMAGAGARVAILDGSHPREKPCGGGVTARAFDLVRDAIDPLDVAAVPIETAAFEHGARRMRMALIGATRPLVSCRAGSSTAPCSPPHACGAHADLRPRHRRHPARDGWVVATRDGALSAGWLLGADGPKSLVRRRVLRPFDRADLSIATGFFVHGPTSRRDRDRVRREQPPGTSGRFRGTTISRWASARRPTRAPRPRCSRARRDGSAGTSQDPWTWCDTAGRSRRCASRRCNASSRPVRGGCCSATPEGWSIRSRVRGFSSRCCPPTPRPTACSAAAIPRPRTARRVRASIHSELIRAARLKDRFFTPRFTGLMIRALQESAAIRHVMSDLIAGRQTYHGLRRRLLGTLEVRTDVGTS